MPYVPARNNMLPPLTPETASVGPYSSPAENFNSMMERQYRVDSSFAMEAEILDRLRTNVERLNELSGGQQAYRLFTEGQLSPWVRQQLGRDPYAWASPENANATIKAIQDYDARVLDLREQNPDIDVQTSQEMFDEVVKMRQEILQEAGEVSDAAGFWGSLAGFAGGVVGSFSPRDPLLLGTLGWGGTGKLLATRVLTEAGVGAGIEAVQQFGFVAPVQEALGEESSPWESIAFAAIGAGALRGLFEGVGPAFRATEERLFPDRAKARVVRDSIDENMNVPLEVLMERIKKPRLDDAALLEAIRKLPPTPVNRAAQAGLAADVEFARMNPYGEGRLAEQRFKRELQRTFAEYNGMELPPRLRPDTAVGRFIDNQLVDLAETPERAIGRRENPELYQRFETANEKVSELELRIEELEGELNSRTMADAVGLLDANAGARVGTIEAELNDVIPRTRREELERELDQIIESIGPEVIARAEQDFRIGPQRQLRDLRKAKNSARKQFNRLQKDVAGVESRLASRARVEAQVSVDPTIERYFPTPATARALNETVSAAEVERPQLADGIVARNVVRETTEEGEEVIQSAIPKGMIDIGEDTFLPEDFAVPIDEAGNTMSARAIMDELNEDSKMLEAMRSCSI